MSQIPVGPALVAVPPPSPVRLADERRPYICDKAAATLRRGQSHESRPDLPAALACYDEAIALLTECSREREPLDGLGALSLSNGQVDSAEMLRTLALAWMNRGNALQKCHPLGDTSLDPTRVTATEKCHLLNDTSAASSATALHKCHPIGDTSLASIGPAAPEQCHPMGDTLFGATLAAYDAAITLLAPLVAAAPADHALRNSLGAAHLNRASALLDSCERERVDAYFIDALTSANHAIATLTPLPLDENIFYRANLGGAHLNRANALLPTDLASARISARTALDLTTAAAPAHLAAAHAALGARRTLLSIIGRELSGSRERERVDSLADAPALLAEASDLIDDGLALARSWESRQIAAFGPAAAQLFHAGAVLYASHQPHFLPEFLDENESLAHDLPAVVQTMLARARRTAHERGLVAVGADPFARTLATLTELSSLSERPPSTPLPS